MLSTWTRGAFVRGGRREVRGRRAYILRRQPEQGVHATTVGECGGLLHSVQRLSRARAACALSGRDLELCWLLLLAHRGQNLVSKTRWREPPSLGERSQESGPCSCSWEGGGLHKFLFLLTSLLGSTAARSRPRNGGVLPASTAPPTSFMLLPPTFTSQ